MDESKPCVVMGGEPSNKHRQIASLLGIAGAVSASVGDSYSDMYYYFPKHSKTRPGTLVRCCVCGKGNATLYKHGKDRICGKCREEQSNR